MSHMRWSKKTWLREQERRKMRKRLRYRSKVAAGRAK